MELTKAEIGMIRWYRELDQRIKNAIHLWLLTGDSSMVVYEFNHRLLAAA